jgi:DNA-3-methyladenine glycosylase II
MGPRPLTAAGLSDRKTATAFGLADAVVAGRIRLGALPPDDVVALCQLTVLRGVGPWSARISLIGQLRRPVILPAARL